MLLLGLSEEGVLWMCFHTADGGGWRGALPSWSFPSPGGEASKNNLSGVDPHPPGPSRNIWQPPHCPLCPGAIRPVILLARDMSHLGACHIESHFCHGTDAPCIQQGEWHLEGSLTSWSGSSSWKTR